MKKRSLLLAMSSLLLLCSCGGTTYKYEASQSLMGVTIEVVQKLTLFEDTFKLESVTTTEYNESAASTLKWAGEVKAVATEIATGTYEEKSLLTASYQELSVEKVKSYIKISGKGKDDYKKVLEAELKLSTYTDEQVADLLAGKTVTVESTGTAAVVVDEENGTFKSYGA